MHVKRAYTGCHFITSSLHGFWSSEMVISLHLNCQFSECIPQLRSFEGFIFCGTLHKVALFSSMTFSFGGDIKLYKTIDFLVSQMAFKALNLTFSNQGQPFYILSVITCSFRIFHSFDYAFSCLLWMMRTRDWTESRKENMINSIRYLELVFKDFTMLNLQICEHSICFLFWSSLIYFIRVL